MKLKKRLQAFFKVAFARWQLHELTKEGAALAFYAALSLVPLLFMVSVVASLALGQHTINFWIATEVGRLAGRSSAQLLQAMMTSAYRASANKALDVIEIVVLVFAAVNFFVRLNEALDAVSGAEMKKVRWLSLFRDYGKAFLLTIFGGFLLGLLLIATAVISSLGDFLSRNFAMPVWFLYFLNSTVLFLAVTVIVALLYRYLPMNHLELRHAVIGAIFTAAFLVIGEYVLGWVFGGGLIGSYGLAGSMIAFLSWIYYSSLFFLFGAEVAYVYFDQTKDK